MDQKTTLLNTPTTIQFQSGNEITIAQENDELIFYKMTAPLNEHDVAGLEIERMPATNKSLNDLSILINLHRLPSSIRQRIVDFIIGISMGVQVETLHTLKHSQEVTSVAYSPDNAHILTGSEDKKVGLWNAKSGELLLKIKFSDSICSVGFSTDSSKLLIDLKTDITDRPVTADTESLKKPKYLYRRVVIDSSAIYLVSTLDYTLGVPEYLLDFTSESPLFEIPGNHSCIAFSSDETTVLSGSEDQKARIWRKEEGQSLITLLYELEHKDPVSSVSYSPDRKIIFTGTNAGTVHIWFSDDGCFLADWNASRGLTLCSSTSINAVAMSPDRKKILTGSNDGTVRLWNAKTKEELLKLLFLIHIKSVAFSPDGKYILIGCENDKAYILRVPSDEIIDWVHNITPFEALFILKAHEAQQIGGSLRVEKNSFEYELFSTLPAAIREYLIKWYKITAEQEDCYKDSSLLEITSSNTSVKTTPSSTETSEMYEAAASSFPKEENLQKDESENSDRESRTEKILKILKKHDEWVAHKGLSQNLMSGSDKKINELHSYQSSTDIPEDTLEDTLEDNYLDKDTHELPCCIQ